MLRYQDRVNGAMRAYSGREVIPQGVTRQCSLKEEAWIRPRRKRIIFNSEQQVDRPWDKTGYGAFEEEEACIYVAGAQRMRAREPVVRWGWTNMDRQCRALWDVLMSLVFILRVMENHWGFRLVERLTIGFMFWEDYPDLNIENKWIGTRIKSVLEDDIITQKRGDPGLH